MNAAKKERQTINVNENIPFESNMKSRYTTSMELCKTISGLFGAAMEDFCGCKVRVNDGNNSHYQNLVGYNAANNPIFNEYQATGKGPGNLYVDLYFKFTGYDVKAFNLEEAESAEELDTEIRKELVCYKRKSVIPVSIDVDRASRIAKASKRLEELKKEEAKKAEESKDEKKESKIEDSKASTKAGPVLSERYMNFMGSRNVSNTYKILPHTYEMLEEFMPCGTNTNWKVHTFETTSGMTMYNSREEIVVCVTGLDVDKILTKIYGEKDSNGIYEYRCLPSTVIANRIDEFVVTIQQLDNNVIRTLSNEIGVYANNPANFYRFDR